MSSGQSIASKPDKNISPIICISQARMTSTRLPGKVLMEIDGKPMLWYHLSRLKRSKHIDKIVVATTINSSDDPIIEFCNNMGIDTFRGDEYNVLSRYYDCAKKYNAKTIVRVTSDCPLIDPRLIDELIQNYSYCTKTYDYIELSSISYPSGFDAEIFSFDSLCKSYESAHKPYHLEHVTSYLYENQKIFRTKLYSNTPEHNAAKLSIDTTEEFERVSSIIHHFKRLNNNHYTWSDCISFLKQQL